MAISQGDRQIFQPSNDEIVFKREVFTDQMVSGLTLVSHNVRGYSNEAGGQAVFTPTVTTSTTETVTAGTTTLEIEFTVDIPSGNQGSDFTIEYTVTDGSVTRTFSFYHQHGVENILGLGDVRCRLSAEIARINSAYTDGSSVSTLFDYSGFGDWDVTSGTLTYVEGSSVYTRFNDESIPYFEATNGNVTLEGPTNLLDQNSSYSVFAVVSSTTNNSSILELFQDNNSLFDARSNATGSAILNNGNGNRHLVASSNASNGPTSFELRYNNITNFSYGTVNREYQDGNAGSILSETISITQGSSQIVLNDGDRLYDIIIYNEDVDGVVYGGNNFTGELNVNKIASHFSYLYNIDMRNSTKGTVVDNRGSVDIANHLYFEAGKDQYNIYLADQSQNFVKLDSDGIQDLLIDVDTGSSSEAGDIAVDANGNIYTTRIERQGTSVFPLFYEKRDSSGNVIWSYEDPNGNLANSPAVEANRDGFSYYLIENTPDLRNFDPDGNLVWSVSTTGSPANNMVVDESGNVYTISVNTSPAPPEITVEKFDNDGNIVWTYIENRDNSGTNDYDITLGESDEVFITNGSRVVAIANDGSQADWVYTVPSGLAECIAFDGNHVFVGTTGNDLIKLDSLGVEQFVEGVVHSNSIVSVAVDAEDHVYTGTTGNMVRKLKKVDGSEVWNYSSSVRDMVVDPGNYKPHWV